jgi:protein-S-isoprenylcysteine O-methyltransferase Ste14
VLSEGIYGRVRHPRYVAIVIGTLGWALFVNYVGVYILAVLTVPAICLVAVLEERELLERFGEEYARYRDRVPPFLPRLGAR